MRKIYYWLFWLILLQLGLNAKELPLQHGVTISDDIKVSNYWISEKLDGMRAFWNGKQLLTRNGNIINAPDFFTNHWPAIALDGELWSDRGEFQQIISCVKRQQASPCWHQIKFMLFDLPHHPGTFSERVTAMTQLTRDNAFPYLQMIHQFRLPTQQVLYQQLDKIVALGGEGLMLHHQQAMYHSGRNQALMKLKPYQDSEAIVIKHLPGKGKYQGMLGALLVETPQGLQFKIGTGFSDQERQQPPALGSIITYKYIGKTTRGVPRFASFLRIRNQE